MKRILTLAFMSLLLAFASFAQETSAGIQGTVKDPSGAAVPGASVEATSSALIAPMSFRGANMHGKASVRVF